MLKLYKIISHIYKHPLNRNSKFLSILQFIQWQLATRILNRKVLIDWVNSAKFLCSRGETGLTGNIYCGLSEYVDMLFLLQTLSSEDLFIDVGANVGAYTILASKVVGARTIAFEPIEETACRLKSQVRLNGIEEKVQILINGVGKHNERLNFISNNDTVNKVAITNEIGITQSVNVVRLDDVIKYSGNMLLKIDVEGFESNVIDGAKDLLSNPNVYAVIIELNNSGNIYGFSNDDIHNKLSKHGFIPILYDPFNKKFNILNNFIYNNMNTIYIRSEKLIKNRLLTAPNYIIHTANKISI